MQQYSPNVYSPPQAPESTMPRPTRGIVAHQMAAPVTAGAAPAMRPGIGAPVRPAPAAGLRQAPPAGAPVGAPMRQVMPTRQAQAPTTLAQFDEARARAGQFGAR